MGGMPELIGEVGLKLSQLCKQVCWRGQWRSRLHAWGKCSSGGLEGLHLFRGGREGWAPSQRVGKG